MTHDEIYAGLRTDISRSLFVRAAGDGYIFRNRCFYGAFKRGYVACIDGSGPKSCKYEVSQPHKTKWRSGTTFSKGLRNYWFLGYDWARHLADPRHHQKPEQVIKPLPKKKPKPKVTKPAAASRRLRP